MSRDRRFRRLEWQYIRQLAAEAGKPYGFRADDILDEARRLVALSDAEQDAEFADALAQAQARGNHEAVRIPDPGTGHRMLVPLSIHDSRGMPCNVNHAVGIR